MLILQNCICISRYSPLKSFLEMSFLVVQKHLIRRLSKLAPIFGLNRNIFTWIFQKFAKIWNFTISHKSDFKCYDVLRRNIDYYGAHKRTLKGHFKKRVFLSNKVGLRVVQTEAILFLKSMSDRVGSVQRLWHRMKIDWRWRHWNSVSFYVGSDSFRHWFQK